MSNIKTREVVKGTIKTIDKSTIVTQKTKDKLVDIKSKSENAYKSNEIIFFEDQPCEYASIILKGSIYMTSLYNDKEINFNYMKKGSIFGHNLIFNNNNKYKAHIIALGNTQILHLTYLLLQ